MHFSAGIAPLWVCGVSFGRGYTCIEVRVPVLVPVEGRVGGEAGIAR